MKSEFKQAKAKLDKPRDNAIDMVGKNAQDAMKEFKKSNKLQEYLNSYGVGSFKMACEDLRRYL